MFSFLDDKELYGSSLDGRRGGQNSTPRAQGSAPPVRVPEEDQGAGRPRQDAEARTPPEQQQLPPQIQDIIFKSFSILEQRLLTLEERMVTALERLSSSEDRACTPVPATSTFWSSLFCIVISIVTALLFVNLFWRRSPPELPLLTTASQPSPGVPYIIQSLPPAHHSLAAGGVALPPPPPTPLFFSAPASFLPR
jgi:hypothetical protein